MQCLCPFVRCPGGRELGQWAFSRDGQRLRPGCWSRKRQGLGLEKPKALGPSWRRAERRRSKWGRRGPRCCRRLQDPAESPPGAPTQAWADRHLASVPKSLVLCGRHPPVPTKPLATWPGSSNCAPEMWFRKEPATYKSGPR